MSTSNQLQPDGMSPVKATVPLELSITQTGLGSASTWCACQSARSSSYWMLATLDSSDEPLTPYTPR